jgi:MFS family permease
MGGLLFGYEIGVTGHIMDQREFKIQFGAMGINSTGEDYEIDSKTLPSRTTFSFLIGAFFGALVVAYIADMLGRKRSILIGGVFFLFGGCFQCLASNVIVFYVGRILSGLGIGILSMCAPL